jgi:hypothetical protein
MLRALSIVAISLWLIACGGSLPSGDRTLSVDEAGFRLEVPAGWHAAAADRERWPGRQTVAYLSNQPMAPACSDDPAEPICTAPVETLRDGGLLMWWLTTTCAGPACDPTGDDRLLIGGRPAVRAVDAYDFCDGLGATIEEDYLVAVSPQRVDLIVVCQRDADTGAVAQVHEVLERVDWRTP